MEEALDVSTWALGELREHGMSEPWGSFWERRPRNQFSKPGLTPQAEVEPSLRTGKSRQGSSTSSLLCGQPEARGLLSYPAEPCPSSCLGETPGKCRASCLPAEGGRGEASPELLQAAFPVGRLGQPPNPHQLLENISHLLDPKTRGLFPSLRQDCASFPGPSGRGLPLPSDPQDRACLHPQTGPISPPQTLQARAVPLPQPLASLCLGSLGGVKSLHNHRQIAPGSSHPLPQLLWTPDTATASLESGPRAQVLRARQLSGFPAGGLWG